MASSYQHSNVFAGLKYTKEHIEENLTSAQYLKTIDTMLNNAVELIVASTSYFDDYLARLIGWQEANAKRKVAFVTRQEFVAAAITYLIQPTKELKLKKLDTLRLDRGIVFGICNNFVKSLSDYRKACDADLYEGNISRCLEYKKRVEDALCSNTPLLPIAYQVEFWVNAASLYKNRVLEKYIRMCISRAQSDYTSFFNTRIPLDDIVQCYVMVAGRALDKCDYRQGVLTSHIQTWLYTARASIAADIDVDSVGSPEIEPNEDLDDAAENNLELLDTKIRIRKLARLADPRGLGRLALLLEEVLPSNERP